MCALVCHSAVGDEDARAGIVGLTFSAARDAGSLA